MRPMIFCTGTFCDVSTLGFVVFFLCSGFFRDVRCWVFEFCSLSLSIFSRFVLYASAAQSCVRVRERRVQILVDCLVRGPFTSLPFPPPRGLSTQGPEHPWHLCRCRHGCTNQTRENNAALRCKVAMENR